MAWTVKYVKNDSVFCAVDIATRQAHTTPVLYSDTPVSSISLPTIAAKAAELDAWIPIPQITNPDFTVSGVTFKYQNLSIFPFTAMAGGLAIFHSDTDTSVPIAININGRKADNMFGYTAMVGGSFTAVKTALYVALQCHNSVQNATHLLVYYTPLTNGYSLCSAILTNANGDNISYGSIFSYNSQYYAAQVARFLSDLTDDAPVESDDPYISAGYPPATAPGGLSQGSFDFTEDGLTAVHTPSIDVLGSGLVTCWNPSIAQLAAVASWLWSTTPSDLLIKLLGNPINAIIGLNILPVQPDVDSGTNTIHFGPEDTAVAAPKCTSQYVTVDCGSLKIEPKYGSYMDYPPNTSAELFLPYCGGLKIDMYDVIDKTISIKYEVDILSGACVAYVFIDGVIHYQKSGMCAASVPVTGANMPNLITGVLNIVGTVATAAASMGASAAGPLTRFAAGATAGASVASSTANMLKTEISYAGTVAGWAGLLGSQTPYLIVTFPNCVIPGGMNMITGYPAWVSGRIGDFSGYTECKIDHVFALGATDAEVDEIKTLLEGGVIL